MPLTERARPERNARSVPDRSTIAARLPVSEEVPSPTVLAGRSRAEGDQSSAGDPQRAEFARPCRPGDVVLGQSRFRSGVAG